MRNEAALMRTYILPVEFLRPLRNLTKWNYADLRYCVYPFDRVCVEFDAHGLHALVRDGATPPDHLDAFRRVFFRRVDAHTHEIVVEYEHETQSVTRSVHFYGAIRYHDETQQVEDVTAYMRPPVPGAVPIPTVSGDRALAAVLFWLPFTTLCYALASPREHFTTEAVVLSRPERRAYVRAGQEPPHTIVLRPGSTPRQAAREFTAARLAAVRSHPRRHYVAGHMRRLTAADGTTRTVPVSPHSRGGSGGRGRHNARLLALPLTE